VRQLRELIITRKVTVKQVVLFYCQKAYNTGRELNLTADENFTNAIKEAEEKDKLLDAMEKEGKDLTKEWGIFFGVPFSVKDQIYVKSTLSTLGLGSRAFNRKEFDAPSVALIREQGGIPFVKGNLPDAALSYFTNSQIWGTAKHPIDHERTVGGSSGGDAGLLASGCSPFALGSDFGGSIRIPCFFCGLTGFLGTPERFSIKGLSCYTKYDGVNGKWFRPVIGPMGRWVDDIVDGMKSLCSETIRNYDKSIPRMPFNEELYTETCNKKLKVGYIENINEICTFERDSMNIYEDSKEAIIKAGHELVPINIPNLRNSMISAQDYLLNEAMPLIFDHMIQVGDNLDPNAQVILFMYNCLPKFIIKVLCLITRPFVPREVSEIMSILHPSSIPQIKSILKTRSSIQSTFTSHFHSLHLDCILTPGYPKEAFKIEEASQNDSIPLHLLLTNFLHLPAGSCKFPFNQI
jgi:fatty acid amide hydrolase